VNDDVLRPTREDLARDLRADYLAYLAQDAPDPRLGAALRRALAAEAEVARLRAENRALRGQAGRNMDAGGAQ
jgi:hypothetical protein